MLPMRLFRSRAFLGINAASLLMFLGMFGSIFLLSQFLQNGLGHSPTEAGLRMLPWTGMPILVAPFAGYLSDRFGGRPVVVTGLALQAVGLSLFALIIEPGVSYTAQLPALIIGGVGMAMYFAPAASLVLSSVRPGEQGIASEPTTRCGRSAGRSGSRCSPPSSPRRAVTAHRGCSRTARCPPSGSGPVRWPWVPSSRS